MADTIPKPRGDQPPPNRGHPMPRRATPEKSITLHHHRLARDATMKATAAGNRKATITANSPRRNSSGESQETSQSDPKKWFDRSNRNVTATFDASSMDVDPPFFQKETDSSTEDQKDLDVPPREPQYPYGQIARPIPHLRPTVTHSSSADDYRSVIDDLTIENKRLKEELKRHKQFGSGMMRKDKLFEIKVHGLPKRKKRELEATLRDFAANLEGSSEATSQRRKSGRHMKNLVSSSGGSFSKHASSSSSHSRPVDSAYASMSGGGSTAPTSSGMSLGRPSMLVRAKSSGEQNLESQVEDTPDGLYPRHILMSEKEKKKLVVRKLEHLFTGKISGRNIHRNQSMPAIDARVMADAAEMAPPPNIESSREAQIQPLDPTQKKTRSRDNLSTSNSNGDQTESGGNGAGSGDGNGGNGSGNGNNASPTTLSPPEQRPTRPHDLDPDRVQIPSENMEYIRHLGLVPPELLIGRKARHHEDVSPDADGWVYLNLLCNLAQLHMISVTPSFIRSAVNEMSAKFQLSPDGRKIRWRGGTDGTKFSSDSSTENSQKSPSTDDTDGSNDLDQRKKQKIEGAAVGETLASVLSSKQSKFGPQFSGSNESFHYKPLFVHQSSSMETSLEETGSQPSSVVEVEDSNLENTGNSKWDYSGSGSSRRKKRRRDGVIVYYSGAPFCIDLSGDPGDLSPTSSGHLPAIICSPPPGLQRSWSGSSLPVRPLSDDPALVAEALDMDLDRNDTPELVWDDGDSPDDDIDFPWCDDPERVEMKPVEPPLEPSGLGGVLPEDYFAVVITTRRPILSNKPDQRIDRSKSADTADTIAGRLASMSTSSPLPHKGHAMTEKCVDIEYLSGKLRKCNPMPLPPPTMFFPPFSSESDDDSSEDDLLSEDEEDSDDSVSEGLISQRANPHQSDNTYPDNEDLSSNDEEDEVDGEGDVDREVSPVVRFRGRPLDPRREINGSTGATSKMLDRLHTGSSAATAGGAESGYNSSMEDDAH